MEEQPRWFRKSLQVMNDKAGDVLQKTEEKLKKRELLNLGTADDDHACKRICYSRSRSGGRTSGWTDGWASSALSDFALVNLVETWCETVSCCVSVKMFP